MADTKEPRSRNLRSLYERISRVRAALTRPVNDFPRWKYHIGHAGIATAIAFVSVAGGLDLTWGVVMGSVIYPGLRETFDLVRYGPKLDSLADFVQHQPPWIIVATVDFGIWQGIGAMAIVLALYFITERWAAP